MNRHCIYINMTTTKRLRTVRSVTLDDSLVERLKQVGPALVPPEINLSRLLDRAMAEMIERYGDKRVRGVRKLRK